MAVKFSNVEFEEKLFAFEDLLARCEAHLSDIREGIHLSKVSDVFNIRGVVPEEDIAKLDYMQSRLQKLSTEIHSVLTMTDEQMWGSENE